MEPLPIQAPFPYFIISSDEESGDRTPEWTFIFSKKKLSREENLLQVWKQNVEQVLDLLCGLSCQLNWLDSRITLRATELTMSGDTFSRAVHALIVLGYGLPSDWVGWIVTGQFNCDFIKITKPKGMTESEFSEKYDDFKTKFEDIETKLPEKLSCRVLYEDTEVVALSDKPGSTSIVRELVTSCLIVNEPFDERYCELSLDKLSLVEDSTKR